MHGNQSGDSGTQLTEFDRRSFLRGSVGTGLTSIVGLSQSVSAQENDSEESSATPSERELSEASFWTYSTDEAVFAKAYVQNNTVYVGDNGGTFHAIDVESGDEKWTNSDPDLPLWTSPIEYEDNVYVVSGIDPDSDNGSVYAFDRDDGSIKWTFDEFDGTAGWSSLAAGDESVFFFAREEENLYAVNAETGDEEWSVEVGTKTSPIFEDEVVYMNTIKGFSALSSDSGEELWVANSYSEGIGSNVSPVSSAETIFLPSYQSVQSINKSDGEQKWNNDEFQEPISTTPIIYDDSIFVTSNNIRPESPTSVITELNKETGDLLWQKEIEGSVYGSLIVNDTLYIGTNSYENSQGDEHAAFYAINASDNEMLWSAKSDAQLTISRTFSDNIFFVSTTSVDHVAIDARNNPFREEPSTAVFEQFNGAKSSQLLWALAGIGSLGGVYVGLKKFYNKQDNRDSINESTSDQSSEISLGDSKQADITISEYNEIRIGETIRESSGYQLQHGKIGDHHFWVLKPLLEDAETVSTAVFEAFSESVDPWAGMDSHPHLVNVLGTGSEPVPWAAIEDADDSTLLEQVDRLSLDETIEALQEVCEALHHVQRYGTVYENLTTNSVLYTDNEGVKLRGILDQFEDPDPWYNAPEEFDNESTEQSTVYRVGLIAYELLTGTLPYSAYPNGDPESKIQSHELISPSEQVATLPEDVDEILLAALSAAPEDRYETVLHLRDELSRI